MDLTIARQIVDEKRGIEEVEKNKRREEELSKAQLYFFETIDASKDMKDCGFDGHFVLAGANNDYFEAIGNTFKICGLEWLLTLTYDLRNRRIDMHLTRVGAQYSNTFKSKQNVSLTFWNKLAELMVETEQACLLAQKRFETFEQLRTVEECRSEATVITNSGYLTKEQRDAALGKMAQRKIEIETVIAKRESDRQIAEGKYRVEQRLAAEKLAQDKLFLQYVIERIEKDNWEPFEIWEIHYVPQNVANIMESLTDEDGERLDIEELSFVIWSELRMPSPSGMFDKITFSPYNTRPISLEGPIVDKTLFKIESLTEKNIPQHFLRRRSFVLPGVYPSQSYRTPYFVNDPKLPNDDDLIIWRQEWEASLTTE